MIALSLALVVFQSFSRTPDRPLNLDFEGGPLAAVPSGWHVSTHGFAAETVEEGANRGTRCARLYATGEPTKSTFGNLMQRIDARGWRATPIRLRASIRVRGEGTQAQMWLRVDCAKGRVGLFDNMDDRPVTSTEWSTQEITGVVDADAEYLNIGLMLNGGGEAWIDAVEIESTGAQREFAPPEPPRALDERGLANLLAFAELFGYVRHFHPSDQAVDADWDDVALRGVHAVEGARDPAELAAALERHFAPVAPTVRVFVQGDAEPELATELRTPTRAVESWRHVGFGQAGGIYRSERIESAADAPGVPDPERPYRAELAGGVACLVPLALHVEGGATLPRAPAAVVGTTDATDASTIAVSGADRATRLADVVIAWNVFQHFYPYFDVTPVDWAAELERGLRAAATDVDERAFLDTLRRMVAALADGHGSVYCTTAPPRAFLPLEWEWIEERVIVTRVSPDVGEHPAPGDAVLAIDGVPIAECLARVEALTSGATPQWIRSRALHELRSRQSAEPCTLQLETHPDGARVEVRVEPRQYRFDAGDQKVAPVRELEDGLWLVDLGRATDEELKAAVDDLADARGIVYDLRGYPSKLRPETIFGHLIREPVTSAQWHLPVVTRPNREDLTFERGGAWDLRPEEPYFEARKAFLVGGGAISYAESCLGIVEHYHLAELVGSPSAGTNGNVNPFVLPGGYSVSWTGMKVLKHDGSRHHGVGILPTIPATRTRAGVAAGRDEVLERALEVVRR